MSAAKQVKVRKVIEAVAAGKSGTQAAIEAGFAPASAHVRASEIIHSPEGKEALKAILAAEGINEKTVIKKLKTGIERGRLESQGYYLDKVMDMLGMVSKKENDSAPTLNLFMNFANRLMTDGVLEVDGTVTRLNEAK